MTFPPGSTIPISFTLLPYLDPLLRVHQGNNQQPDNLCGPYWISLLLQAYGGLTVTAVEVAIAASTTLPNQGNPREWLPPNAHSLQGPHYDQIPTQADPSSCGTAITGLIHATQTLSQEKFCLIPLQLSPPQLSTWQDGLSTLWSLCHGYPTWQAIPLLNSHTSYFWGTNPTPHTLISYLQSKPISSPTTDWSVGHFNLLIGAVQQNANTLYTLLDTYPQFGWQGLHFQPPDALSQSLHRPQQTTQGGLALFLRAEFRSDVEQVVSQNGFKISGWDNGSPVDVAR
ncbi:DUF6885 family protein [Leptothoe sp. PORK10 BA2]|uniref:DUF6885 family protein n=1 Tax=Leptothoe sp. PORK10 BA2 TaxID=3110254 RepID=UPI002B21A4B0|nr:hypothetical protein [Leptothoe sp. PORK10 BA2]MEA5465841.1 hypothetical protein [Leptothoe sp. PORK10 BA2]